MSGQDRVDVTATAAPLAETRPSGDGAAPATIGRFEIVSRLGAGGMGVVMLATDPLLGRKVAIKIVRGERTSDAAKRRLLREAQAMAQLSHENTIVVHEVGEHAGEVYVAMEYVVGTTLAQWQAGRTWREIVDMYLRAGRGLQAAHDAGLVHRDFKPDNVLVGDDGRLRVTDFGLVASGPTERGVAAGARSELDTTLTQTGALLGTPRYMAPEQHLGEEVDARADQFAFCVALYEALFAHAPFPGATYDELATSVLAGEVRPMPDASDVPPAIRSALRRGLSRDPEARFGSMRELLAALSEAPRRARRWPAIAAIGLVAMVVALIAARAPRSHRTATDPAESAAAADRRQHIHDSFAQGATAFYKGDYPAAARAFADGYEIDHQPVFLYDEAASMYMQQRAAPDAATGAKAAELFARYLAEEPQAYDRAQIEALLAAPASGTGALPAALDVHGFTVIESNPSGATLYVDAKRTPLGITPWTGWLPGKHHFRVEKPGYRMLETYAEFNGAKLTSLLLSMSSESDPDD